MANTNPPDTVVENSFVTEIETLKSMFGDLVSSAVILAVLESCNGDVNAAAEGIMNITFDGNSPNEEGNGTGGQTKPNTETEIPCDVVDSSSQGYEVNQFLLNPAAAAFVPVTAKTQTMTDRIEPQNYTIPSPLSYAASFKNTGALPKSRPNQIKNQSPNQTPKKYGTVWTQQIQNIVNIHNEGHRILVVMRGMPGCGKSSLARNIIENTIGGTMEDFGTHIFSTDDHFMVRGRYQFDRSALSEAHMNNQKRVCSALNKGLSPVIVDNTNVALWEMEPYVRDGVRNGYIIEIVEPNTTWSRNANQLARRNVHNVPRDKIKMLMDKYEPIKNTQALLKYFRVLYPVNMKPPIMRNIPPYSPPISIQTTSADNSASPKEDIIQSPVLSSNEDHNITTINENFPSGNVEETIGFEEPDVSKEISEDIMALEDQKKLDRLLQAQQQIKEIQNLEKEWEEGESWDTSTSTEVPQAKETEVIVVPKPPRCVRGSRQDDVVEPIIEPSKINNDWSQILFMPPWQDKPVATKENIIDSVETTSSSTCVEIGDAGNIYNMYFELMAHPRDINENNQDKKPDKIPHQRTFDKSTSTHEHNFDEPFRCKNEEKHFSAFRKLFKDVPRPVLRDVFEKCLGDVNWAVNIVLDSMGNNPLDVGFTEISDTEEEEDIDCDCLAAYSIIPDKIRSNNAPTSVVHIDEIAEPTTPPPRKPKREKKISESNDKMELKRMIESNVVISKDHYSQHHLSVRRARREVVSPEPGPSQTNIIVPDTVGNTNEIPPQVPPDLNTNTSTTNACKIPDVEPESIPGPSQSYKENYFNIMQEKMRVMNNCVGDKTFELESDDDKSVASETENVSINLGMEFVKKLDELFGREGIIYPESIKPTVSIPMSILSEINALWAESIAFQMDQASRQTDEMVRQDEEFARQLALKEHQMAMEGTESSLPDFREIMDMDLALSIYNKDITEQWKSTEPNDLAAKMTREKLFDLFPDINKDILCELLMAHNNSFQATVESLLISTGQGYVLNTPNGVNKFVMEKEVEKKERILEEERKALSETEWPLLPNKGQLVDMNTVNHYREEAERFLVSRNANFNKAKYYIDRNQLNVAAFYSDIAAYNKQRYDYANSLAAASLIMYHASNKAAENVVDLHYLRVAEAKESLDIFIDSKIQKLRDMRDQARNPKALTIFIITGRGAHSPGLPRIKPAVIKRLRDREMRYKERNPGLLVTKVTYYRKLTHELYLSD